MPNRTRKTSPKAFSISADSLVSALLQACCDRAAGQSFMRLA